MTVTDEPTDGEAAPAGDVLELELEAPPADTPPKRTRRARADKAPAEPKRTRPAAGSKGGRPRNRKLDTELSAMFATIGTMVMAGGAASPRLAYDGLVIMQQSDDMGRALAEAAKTNARLEATLFRMLDTSAMGAVGLAFAPVVVAILANHGMIPTELPTLFGLPAPEPIEPKTPAAPSSSPWPQAVPDA